MSSFLLSSSTQNQKGNRNRRYIQSSSSYLNILCSFEKTVRRSFLSKYNSTPTSYNKNIINNIIYNEKTRIVALFKDYLITDDSSEFLKRYYTKKESGVRLPRFFEYYETYSKLFPNYTALIEGKYIYKNIQKKQRMIDLQERMELEEKNKKKNKIKNTNNKSNEVFSTDVYDSIINDRDTEEIEMLFNIQLNEMEKEEKEFKDFIDRIVAKIEKYDEKPIIHHELNTSRSVKKPNYSKFLSKQNSNIINVINDTENNKEEDDINKINPKTERTLVERIELNLLRINKKKQHTNSISTTKTSKPKLSDLRLLYQKNVKVNLNSNIPLTYRGNSIASETAKTSKSPLTDRTHTKTVNKSTKSCVVNTNSSTVNNVNNIIYIINQNPKFTTNVNVFNSTTRTTARRVISSIQSRSNSKKSSSISRKTITQKIPFQTITNKTLTKNSNIHKRNFSNFINNNGLKTARDIGYKELNILKSAAQKNNHKDEAYTSRYNYNYNNYLKNKNDMQKISRNIRNSSNEKSTHSNNKNYISRNDSLTKLGFLDSVNIKKKIKGIQIRNFSKIFNVNLSQIQSKTDRYSKIK